MYVAGIIFDQGDEMGSSIKIKMIGVTASLMMLISCAAIETKPGAEKIAIVAEKPNPENCELLGEVAGSQGNWFTGGYTSDKNLMVGARNDLRNAAQEMGGNTVFMQNVNSSGRFLAAGTSSTIIVGYAYRCK